MNDPFDLTLADWMRDGPERGPQEGLDRALAATRRASQRPGWTFLERWLPVDMILSRTPSARPFLILVAVALLALALIAVALVGAPRPTPLPAPFGPARDGLIAFERDGDLFLADALDQPARLLVGGATDDRAPTFSRQGDAIAFQRVDPAGGIHLMRVAINGQDVRELAGPFPSVAAVAWSPDGQQLLVTYGDDQPRVAVVAADGSGRRELAFDGAADYASWRPDGRTIAFRGTSADEIGPEVFLAAADGTDVRSLQLADFADADEYFGLTWSPDGTRLAYSHYGDLGFQVDTADIDPTGSVTGVHDPRYIPGSTSEMLPQWSPDSRSLAFIADLGGQRQVAIAPADGSAPARFVGPQTTPQQAGFGFDWSPDGRTLLISMWPREGDQKLWSIDVASGDATQQTGVSLDVPSWQRVAADDGAR